MRAAGVIAMVVIASLSAGCSDSDTSGANRTPGSSSLPTSAPDSPTTPSSGGPAPRPVRFEAARVMRVVRLLAGKVGPRLATSPAYADAARIVAERFRALGYEVTSQRFPVPAGDSWGTPVDAGRSSNVIATPDGFEPSSPHLLVGAHLDTVAVAPGAEDNASGVGILLELARLATHESPRLPTVFVAFGAEEPVGPGDLLHHFGSRHYVSQMRPAQRASLHAMVSLDRVGVGARVPVCTGPLAPARTRAALLRSARRLDIPAFACENVASDHWSFEKAGFAVARLGSTPYAAYHSAADAPTVVDPEQLRRVGRVAWGWLRNR